MTDAPSPRCSSGTERAHLATLVYEAMRFAIWAAGQGIMAQIGEPTKDPEDFLFDYSQAMDVDDWEGLAEVARDAIGVAQAGRTWDVAISERVMQLEAAGANVLSISAVLGLIAFVRDGEGSVVSSTEGNSRG